MPTVRHAWMGGVVLLVLLGLGAAWAVAEESRERAPAREPAAAREGERGEGARTEARPAAREGKEVARPAEGERKREEGRADARPGSEGAKTRLVFLARLMELAAEKGDADLIDFVDQMLREEINRQKKAARNPEARAGGEGEAKREGDRKPVGEGNQPRVREGERREGEVKREGGRREGDVRREGDRKPVGEGDRAPRTGDAEK